MQEIFEPRQVPKEQGMVWWRQVLQVLRRAPSAFAAILVVAAGLVIGVMAVVTRGIAPSGEALPLVRWLGGSLLAILTAIGVLGVTAAMTVRVADGRAFDPWSALRLVGELRTPLRRVLRVCLRNVVISIVAVTVLVVIVAFGIALWNQGASSDAVPEVTTSETVSLVSRIGWGIARVLFMASICWWIRVALVSMPLAAVLAIAGDLPTEMAVLLSKWAEVRNLAAFRVAGRVTAALYFTHCVLPSSPWWLVLLSFIVLGGVLGVLGGLIYRDLFLHKTELSPVIVLDGAPNGVTDGELSTAGQLLPVPIRGS